MGTDGNLVFKAQGAGVDRKVAMAVKKKTAEFCPQASGWWTGLWGMISLAAGPKL